LTHFKGVERKAINIETKKELILLFTLHFLWVTKAKLLIKMGLR